MSLVPSWCNKKDRNVCTPEETGTVLAHQNMDLSVLEQLFLWSQTAKRSSCSTWWAAHLLDRRLDGVQPTADFKPCTGARLVKGGVCLDNDGWWNTNTRPLCGGHALLSTGKARRSHVTACYQQLNSDGSGEKNNLSRICPGTTFLTVCC